MSRQLQGLKAWLLQRVTAVYLAFYSLYLLFIFAFSSPFTYVEWRAWVAQPVISVSMMLYLLALALHAWVGMRDIVIDYVKPMGLKLFLLSVLAFALIGNVYWALQAILLLHVGATA